MPCCCGYNNSDRVHHFWVCPIAQRVVEEVDAELFVFDSNSGREHTPLVRADIWLARPQRGVRLWLWRLVSLIAIAAIDSGRTRASRLQLTREHDDSTVILDKASRSAVARFWSLLAEAATGQTLPISGYPQEIQPFLLWNISREVWMPHKASGT